LGISVPENELWKDIIYFIMGYIVLFCIVVLKKGNYDINKQYDLWVKLPFFDKSLLGMTLAIANFLVGMMLKESTSFFFKILEISLQELTKSPYKIFNDFSSDLFSYLFSLIAIPLTVDICCDFNINNLLKKVLSILSSGRFARLLYFWICLCVIFSISLLIPALLIGLNVIPEKFLVYPYLILLLITILLLRRYSNKIKRFL
jgi:hypothetical protein